MLKVFRGSPIQCSRLGCWIAPLTKLSPCTAPLVRLRPRSRRSSAVAARADALLARPFNLGLRDTLTLHCAASLIALAQQAQHCSVGIAEQFAAHYRQTRLLHTINLPTQAALRLLARALLHTLGLAAAAEPTGQPTTTNCSGYAPLPCLKPPFLQPSST